jgi:predicted nucleic acid-binding protein
LSFLLDTNVVSELRKLRAGKADAAVAAWAASVSPTSMYLSAVVIMELEIGVLRAEHRDPRQGAILREWLDGHVLLAFEDRILPVGGAVARAGAAITVRNVVPMSDALIAATAIINDMTVVTRNVDDFSRSGARFLNPWERGAG